VQLCVSEAVSNAVVHAYRGRDRDDTDPATVRVAADVEEGVLRVIVEDDGIGPSPRLDSPGLGIGLALIAATASEAEISARSPTGARVCMQFATS
jgi:serine/threonine-protein kinase RsbW